MEVYGEAAAGVDAAVLRALGVRQLVTTDGPLVGSWLLAGARGSCQPWPVAAAEPWPAPQPLLHPPAPPVVRVLSAPAALTPRQPPAVSPGSGACSAPPPPPPPAADQPKGQRKPCASQLFRLRQKGLISDLEQKVAHKLSELQLLSHQNDRLRRRADVLRAAVEGRNHQIGILASPPAAAPLQPSPSAPAAAVAAAAAEAAAGPCPAVAAASEEPSPSTATPWWERTDGAVSKEELEAATQAEVVCLFMDYVAACRRGLAALAEEEEYGECAMEEQEGGSSEARSAAPAPPTSTGAATGADGAGGQPADGCQPPAGGLFLFDSSTPRPAAGSARRELFDLVNTRVGLIKHLLLLHPKIIVPLIGVDLQTGARAKGSEYGRALWARVVAALALSEEQRAGIVAARELHEREMASILEERAALQAELAGTQPQGAHADAPAQLGSDWNDATTWQMEAAEALSRNLQKEQAARGLLYHFLFGGNTLSYIQMARLQVASFPFVADADAIAEAVWLEAGAPDAAAPPPLPSNPSLSQRKERAPNERAARAAARAQRS